MDPHRRATDMDPRRRTHVSYRSSVNVTVPRSRNPERTRHPSCPVPAASPAPGGRCEEWWLRCGPWCRLRCHGARVVHVEMTIGWSVLRSSPPERQRLRAAVGMPAGHFPLAWRSKAGAKTNAVRWRAPCPKGTRRGVGSGLAPRNRSASNSRFGRGSAPVSRSSP
jgi:hypothetical protein